MSVEEAKRVTATFAGQTFAPPPRTIADILDLVGPLSDNLAFHSNYRPSATDPSWVDLADPTAGAKIFHAAGRNSRRLGQFSDALTYFRKAAERVKPGSGVPEDTQWPWFTDLGVAVLRDLADTEATSGNYWNAVNTYERAIAAIPGNPGWAELRSGLAEAYARTGNFRGAASVLAQLESIVRGYPHDPRQTAEAESSLAATRAALAQSSGRLVEAERFWRQSIQILEGPGIPGTNWLDERRAARISRLAECLLRQGRLLEAELEARRAILERQRRVSGFAHDHVGTVTLLASILRAQGRYPECEAIARAAIRLYAIGGASPISSVSVIAPRLVLAAVLAAQGQWVQALAEYRSARRDLADDALWERLMGTDPALPYSMLRAGNLGEATVAVERVLLEVQRSRGPEHRTTAELRGLRAMAHGAAGDHARALEDFRFAARVFIDRRSERDDEVTTEEEQDQRIRAIVGAYVALLTRTAGGVQPSPAALAEAFRVAQAAHLQSTQRALEASAARAVTQTRELAELVRREQDASKQIAALQGLLITVLSGPSSGSGADAEGDLRARIQSLRQARHALVQEITKRHPSYAQLVNPAPVTVEQARGALRPTEVLVTTFVTDEKTYVWAVPKSGPLAFAIAPIGEKSLDELVNRVRAPLTSSARTIGEIPAFDLEAAHELYRLLLEPVEAARDDALTLFVVQDGPLGHVPLALLPTRRMMRPPTRAPLFAEYRDVPWLIRRYAVTALPSVTALTALRAPPAPASDRRPFVGFGDPYFTQAYALAAERAAAAQRAPTAIPTGDEALAIAASFRNVVASPDTKVESSRLTMLPGLPDTREEILTMARVMGADLEKDVFLGRAANERAVKTLELWRYRVIAFATHGLVPGDLDGLTQPALALTDPTIANVEGDGVLTMDEILGLRLNADWVVLSACNTANGAGAGAAAVSGLGRAFFYAGARALLLTHWPVETTSAHMLTTDLFRRQAVDPSLTRAKALQQTMNALIDDGRLVDPTTGKVVFSYAHPIFWAPFALVGDGG